MTQKFLFIDRDGTLISEPPVDFQVDRFEKLAFEPQVIPALLKLQQEGYKLVMITNQDGLGTASLPQNEFDGPHNLMMQIFSSQGVNFEEVLICPHLPADNCNCRKPKTQLVLPWLEDGVMDKAHSYVIGDRATDILLARNLGARGILLAPPAEGLRTLEEAGAADACALITDSWSEIAEFIRRGERRAEIRRETRETQITVPTTEYSAPRRECCADEGCEEDPCELFSRVDFPVRAFYPEGSDCGGTSCCGSCGK